MLNKYIWEIYLSSGGKDIVELFESNLTTQCSVEYIERIKAFHKKYNPCDKIIDEHYEVLELLIEGYEISDCEDYTIKNLLDLIWKDIVEANDSDIKDNVVFEIFIDLLPFLSTALTMVEPKLFIPYYFKFNFNIFVMISEVFNIKIPEIPKKSDYRGRFYYYGEICEALNIFRKENSLSVYELCAFLYDFAPSYVGGIKSYIVEELCEPKNAYFIGGTKSDRHYSSEPTSITIWQCNPDTRVGDMLLMYLRSPISAIDSVWRSVSIGFVDPFFYYYQINYIGNPNKVKKITINEMKNDNIIKNIPIVKKNMQGVNGTELKPSEYNYIIDILDSNSPRLENAMKNIDDVFCCEKDVEEKLVKVLLSKLGYKENDYVRQLYIPIGNNNNLLIPDFVLSPKKNGDYYTCFAVIETKFQIENQRKLNKARLQARSYSKQLSATFSVIASKENIWIYSINDDYMKCIYKESWSNLDQIDSFREIKKILEKR